MKKRRNFTIIPNELLGESQLSIPAKYLQCVLTKYAGQDDYCFPSQETLANDLGVSTRYIRKLLNELIKNKLISKKRTGFNKSNTYTIVKDYVRNSSSGHIGPAYPVDPGTNVPTKTTYRNNKREKRSSKGFQKTKDLLIERGILPPHYGAASPKGK